MSMPLAFVMKSFSWDFRRANQETRDLRKVEPYVLAYCADATGAVHRSVTPIYANSPRRGRQEMTGVGHIFYGQKDPKGVLAFAVAIIESDEEIRRAGTSLADILDRPELTNTARATSSLIASAVRLAGNATPVVGIVDNVVGLLQNSLRIAARVMGRNPDDIMWVNSGSFLADTTPPYNWGRRAEARSAKVIRKNAAFKLEYEVIHTSTDLAHTIELEAASKMRRLPTIFTP